MTRTRNPIAGVKRISVGLDWLNIRGPASALDRVLAWGDEQFGTERVQGGGRHGFTASVRWASGAEVWYSAAPDDGEERKVSPYLLVSIPGAALAEVNADVRMEWVCELFAMGVCHATRLDLAADFFGERLSLVQAVEDACKRLEHCGARSWRPVRSYRAGNVLDGHTVYLGKRRSDGAGAMLRVYDKGLESKAAPAGCHQRYEVQCVQEVARAVLGAVVQAYRGADGPVEVETDCLSGGAGWAHQALRIILGTYDFRVNNGQRHRSRRPRASWWSAVLGSVQALKVRASGRSAAGLDRFKDHFRRTVMPTVKAMADLAGKSAGEVLEELQREAGVVKPKRASLVARQYQMEQYRAWSPWLAEEDLREAS